VTDPAADDAALTYAGYLALDELLGAQRPRSDEHDELLFIVVHHVYELWFKQLLHELRHAQARLEDGHTAPVVQTLRRVLTILKVVVAQVDVIETMTPRQFLSFRDRLAAASGFQSAQFRELEAVLGRRDPSMLDAHPTGGAERQRIAAALARPSVYDSFLRYLAAHGFAVPAPLLRRTGTDAPGRNPELDDVLLAVYADDGGPAQVCERLIDLDEGLQEWRYRHVKMVERTIGDKTGTGGSSGAAYLRATLFAPLFPDLWAIRSRM
jgi:tryptophan 2,3-dioxygenase